jgi:hypothetical protein
MAERTFDMNNDIRPIFSPSRAQVKMSSAAPAKPHVSTGSDASSHSAALTHAATQ